MADEFANNAKTVAFDVILDRARNVNDAITGVTAAYLQVRYGETDLPSAETAELREQLERVRPIGAAD